MSCVVLKNLPDVSNCHPNSLYQIRAYWSAATTWQSMWVYSEQYDQSISPVPRLHVSSPSILWSSWNHHQPSWWESLLQSRDPGPTGTPMRLHLRNRALDIDQRHGWHLFPISSVVRKASSHLLVADHKCCSKETYNIHCICTIDKLSFSLLSINYLTT